MGLELGLSGGREGRALFSRVETGRAARKSSQFLRKLELTLTAAKTAKTLT